MYVLPAEYTLTRETFDILSAAVADRIPASPNTPWRSACTLADWRHFGEDGRRRKCFAIQCPYEWVAYAVFITAHAILAAELPAPATTTEIDAMMLELNTRQHLLNGAAGALVSWPTITVASE
ncbi:hypothetical protein [Nocardia sp. CY41]|uniref:hypothetical protein n=1 Tax=Nocardia sp. CY41 TaxID=2608686 RepID=UPI001359B586|nr:hypothetical protein [Nocardia sp. CY41]